MRVDFFQRLLKKDQTVEETPELAGQGFVAFKTLLQPLFTILFMVVLVVITCLVVVRTAFEYRTLFNYHQELVQQRDELQVEWGQLLLEQSAWAANNRVEQQASSKLGMKVPEVNQIEIIRNER